MLNAMGYDAPVIAFSGEDGIKKAEKIKPDLVLMDIVLPGVDGIDAAEEIRNRFDIPVVFLTAHTDERTSCKSVRHNFCICSGRKILIQQPVSLFLPYITLQPFISASQIQS